MSVFKRFSVTLAVLAVCSCATSNAPVEDDYFVDDFSVEAPVESVVSAPAPVPAASEPVTLSVESKPAITPAYASAPQTVTEVGKKVSAIEAKLRQVQDSIKKNAAAFADLKVKSAADSLQYYELVSRIRARLQNGTTPANPELTAMWKQASSLLSVSGKNLSETTKLASDIARIKGELDSLLATVSDTYRLPGALEADHERLKGLEDEANQTVVSANRLNTEISALIARRQQYFNAERQNIAVLESEVQQGKAADAVSSVAVPAVSSVSVMAEPAVPVFNAQGRRPLMRIPAGLEYEQPLYQAMKTSLERRPDVRFDVVAVTPANSSLGEYEALSNAKDVVASMKKMGMPADRVSLSKVQNASVTKPEVRLYVK